MSAALPAPPAAPLRTKRWTRKEVDVLLEAGLLAGQRYELIEGELIDKMGQKPPRAYAIRMLNRRLVEVFGAGYGQCQLPVEVAEPDREHGAPEPDLVVLNRKIDEFPARHPEPADIVLLVEIGDATAAFDLTVKAALYARAGVREYWVLDVASRRLVVHRDPHLGLYRSLTTYFPDDTVSPLSAPETPFRVRDFLA